MYNCYVRTMLNDDLSLKDFALVAARTCGFALSIRDEDLGPVPRDFEAEPDLGTAKVRLDMLRAQLEDVEGWPQERQLVVGNEERDKAIAAAKETLEKHQRNYAKLEAMADQIARWNAAKPYAALRVTMWGWINGDMEATREAAAQAGEALANAELKEAAEYFEDYALRLKTLVEASQMDVSKREERAEKAAVWVTGLYEELEKVEAAMAE